MIILGIESSCDDTGIGIYDSQKGLLANVLYRQIEMHQQFGGIVPELASRDHIKKINPLIKQALKNAKLTKQDLDGIAYTAGPGLIGALLVGSCFAKSLALGLNIPALAINHMEAHLHAPMLEEKKPSYPFLALLISGGHTLMIMVKAMGEYELLGETLDDAVGEAFDKTAKLLGLEYPGGPQIEKLATRGNPDSFVFPKPMTGNPGLDFSFSGLKTFALNTWNNSKQNEQNKADIAYAFQKAVIDTFIIKIKRAIKQTKVTQVVLAGGVSANQTLRKALNDLGNTLNIEFFYPHHDFCMDNGAMVAYLGCQRMLNQEQDKDLSINVKSRWAITNDIYGDPLSNSR